MHVLLQGHDGYGIAAFTASYARQTCRLSVARDGEPDQPWHAHVIGKKTDGVRRCLRKGCTILVTPRSP